MRQGVADKLRFVVSVAPIFFYECPLAKSFFENELTEATQADIVKLQNRHT